MMTPLLVGIDVGTTSVKATLFDDSGTAIRTFADPYPMKRPAPGLAEQDPADWTSRVAAALRLLSDGLPEGAVAAVGLTSQVNTHVFIGMDGAPLMPAITWQDGRAGAEAAELDALISAEERIGWWGAPLPIDASHPLARALWLQRHHPDLWARTRWLMAPKDYSILQLTGEATADPMAAFGVIDQSLTYVPRLLDLVPGVADRLPPLRGFTQTAGRIRSGLPLAGAPMVTGAMDAWAGLIGTGVLRDGECMYLSGTSEIVGLVSSLRHPAAGVIAFPTCEGITMHAGPTQAGGASLAWLSNLTGRAPSELSALVAAGDPHRPTPLFLPHLQGERAPIWDIGARGACIGLDGSMGPAELTRAVFEGVASSVRWLLEALEASAGRAATGFSMAGGGAASDPWCQIRADMLGRPIRRLKTLDAGVLGAAILAGVGAGRFSSIGEAANRLVVTDRMFEPDPSRRERMDFLYGEYRTLYSALKPFNAARTAFTAW
ncbi:FGGY-family carbohydrate kinase [Pleomorphomonas sp. NRK KF1]|uniref:xylulokinase n=1 Tax=Pleomorphomonas sp. NRK KF1 TaxID=2943000 RepID=UPI00204353A3|nr:FGGY-family carbohydrate kinase [Pleomorphomonas sp. NRK KF1]MCM5554508.1 FGGY-family carbohydrate kinase [Pleomorphomonas sp. NRK KF1]